MKIMNDVKYWKNWKKSAICQIKSEWKDWLHEDDRREGNGKQNYQRLEVLAEGIDLKVTNDIIRKKKMRGSWREWSKKVKQRLQMSK
jgi:hypothetical protein